MGSSPRCAHCGREVPSASHFCPGCGARLDDPRSHGQQPRLHTGLLQQRHLLHGRYTIVHKLAQGGQSAVYLAMDMQEKGVQRAIKEMSESNLADGDREKAIRDFRREADMLRTLRHPALAEVYEVFIENQKHFLVMEYVPGHNLEDELLRVGRPLPWASVARWGMALCEVLRYLHQQNPPIIYRDLKPSNVMLMPNGEIKLIDFGIARWLNPQTTRDTTQLGTDGYAPPEQYAARSEVRSDLYALGASLYHLLTGRVPEAAPMRSAGRTLTPIRAINSAVPEPLDAVVRQALGLLPSDRFQDAAHMRHALEWALQAGGNAPQRARVTAAPVVTQEPRPPSGLKPRPAVTAPRLHVWPIRLDAGFLPANTSHELVLQVANRGTGALSGETETNVACISVNPSRLDEHTQTLRVQVNAHNLPAGQYTCHVAVRTNGGDQIIPVRFVVVPVGIPGGHARQTGA